jgi:hypothetical protein
VISGHHLVTRARAQLPPSHPPVVFAVIDTEEEFDWRKPFDRDSVGVSAMQHIWRAQNLFEEYGICPVYVADYPVLATESSYTLLRDFADRGVADVGIHLHPWVNPPYEEKVSARNSYQANLAPDLEQRKLNILADTMEENLGKRPKIHKAGRYGAGPQTTQFLAELGIEIDLSTASGFDLSGDGGPDYSHVDASIYRIGEDDGVFGLPTTGGFMGPMRSWGPYLYNAQRQESSLHSTISRALSRFRLVERVMISPEGHSLNKLKRMTRSLISGGTRVISFSFHSPTVHPNFTPYTQSSADVEEFLMKCRLYFEFFLGELGGVSLSPEEIIKQSIFPNVEANK